MLAPERGSSNAEVSDKTPLVGETVLIRLSRLFGGNASTSNTTADGYIEFGSMTEHSETRTLGIFAGVFSPVTLSMFTALIFLRVDETQQRASSTPKNNKQRVPKEPTAKSKCQKVELPAGTSGSD